MIDALLADAQDCRAGQGAPESGIGACLARCPELAPRVRAMRLLSGLSYGVVRPVLRDSTAIGTLMRRKLELDDRPAVRAEVARFHRARGDRDAAIEMFGEAIRQEKRKPAPSPKAPDKNLPSVWDDRYFFAALPTVPDGIDSLLAEIGARFGLELHEPDLVLAAQLGLEQAIERLLELREDLGEFAFGKVTGCDAVFDVEIGILSLSLYTADNFTSKSF